MARKIIQPSFEIAGKGRHQAENVKAINDNFQELYAGAGGGGGSEGIITPTFNFEGQISQQRIISSVAPQFWTLFPSLETLSANGPGYMIFIGMAMRMEIY